MLKKVILILGIILLLGTPSFAGGLTSGLAFEYYHQGVNCEASGMLFEAKVFYQKTLLLYPAINDADIIRGKIDKINVALGMNGQNSIPPVQSVLVSQPSNYALTYSQNPREIIQIYDRRTVPQPSIKGKELFEVNTMAPETEVIPQRKVPEFLSYYNGSEPFLQNCYTPLCQKIILNNFGISYAQNSEFTKARGMFEECLKIDSYFKPASFNLSLIDELEREGSQ